MLDQAPIMPAGLPPETQPDNPPVDLEAQGRWLAEDQFGVWSMQHAPLGELVHDSLADFKQRGWIQPTYLDHMLAMQRGPHAGYYGVMIWVTMMLERWLQENSH